jgi:hypothetical protein
VVAAFPPQFLLGDVLILATAESAAIACEPRWWTDARWKQRAFISANNRQEENASGATEGLGTE